MAVGGASYCLSLGYCRDHLRVCGEGPGRQRWLSLSDEALGRALGWEPSPHRHAAGLGAGPAPAPGLSFPSATEVIRGTSALAYEDSGVLPYLGAPVRNGVRGVWLCPEAESEFFWAGSELGFGCFGIRPKERMEEAGAALAEASGLAAPEAPGGHRGAVGENLGLSSSQT